ncbi:uncharacterized protein BT62DRAFT_7613 [Guyanagaster necrorhizus]|uniref:F-box domain-containing protein n=1 Tax=Guyanagaster necrorhizus TaxID=856835 RepID=A0A9P7W356_9AGAR|nr:uncharacterized protein BT62DRAFT_7613 [Guyanagaster necrorhizus MCA 3950]KAG7452536.1 hypothetical protein BT62DRAFT_7613 [Guyanagaster necrorhizus MCA 3950]
MPYFNKHGCPLLVPFVLPMPQPESLFIHYLLSWAFTRRSPCFFYRLPLDVLLYTLFPYLSVGDVVALRKASKPLFLLSQEPSIWRRFLSRLDIPTPPLPYFTPYTVQSTDLKIEQMVATAISVNRNWEKPDPELVSYFRVRSGCKILDMYVLPGGQYVASSSFDYRAGYRVMVSNVELPSNEGLFALASISTLARPEYLQARYMVHNNKPGIMVWFVVKSKVGKSLDGSDMLDPSTRRVGYTCHFAHISLESLSNLVMTELPRPMPLEVSLDYRNRAIDPSHSQPGSPGAPAPSDNITTSAPFTLLRPYTFRDPIHDPVLFTSNGSLYLTLAILPDEVVIINLDTQEARSFICNNDTPYSGFDHQIRAVRVLPEQGDVLVIRTVINGLNDVHVMEIYSLPPSTGRFRGSAKHRVVVEHKQVDSFQLSDPYNQEYPSSSAPPPISVYLETTNPHGVIHYTISPSLYSAAGTSHQWWCYDLNNVVPQTTFNAEQVVRVLPGVNRAIICTLHPDENHQATNYLTAIRRYFNPEKRFDDLLSSVGKDLIPSKQSCRWRPKHVYRTFNISPHIMENLNRQDITAFAWDETTGRMCFATRNDMHMHVFDFGSTALPRDHIGRWNSLKRILRIDQPSHGAPESPHSDAEMAAVEELLEPDNLCI